MGLRTGWLYSVLENLSGECDPVALQCNVSKEERSQAILENNTAKILTSKVPLIFFRVALE